MIQMNEDIRHRDCHIAVIPLPIPDVFVLPQHLVDHRPLDSVQGGGGQRILLLPLHGDGHFCVR